MWGVIPNRSRPKTSRARAGSPRSAGLEKESPGVPTIWAARGSHATGGVRARPEGASMDPAIGRAAGSEETSALQVERRIEIAVEADIGRAVRAALDRKPRMIIVDL